MYRISTKSITSRVAVSRAGARLRRLPHVVLATGQSIKIAPGRSVQVTEPVLRANLALLREFAELIDVTNVTTGEAFNVLDRAPSVQVSVSTPVPEPAEIVAVEPPEAPEVVEEVAAVEDEPAAVEEVPEPAQETPEEVAQEAEEIASAPEEAEVVEEPAPKRRGRRKKTDTEGAAPKRRGRKKKSEDA